MFTIIGGDGKEYGPVSTEQVRGWLSAGRANQQTLARRDGETEWKPLGRFPEFGDVSGSSLPPTLAGSPASASGQKSTYTPAGPVNAKAYADDLIARAPKIDVFECLTLSFNLLKTHFLPLVGVTALVLLLQMALGLIPVIGSIAGIFLNGVFYGGLYYYYLGRMRGEPRELADVFSGFTRAFVPLMLASLLISGITIGVLMVFAGPAFFAMVAAGLASDGQALPQVGGLAAIGIVIGFLIVLYLSISWSLAFALVIDKGLGPWTALEVSRRVVGSQWFRVFFVLLLGGILAALGLIALFIGVIFTLPLIFGALLYAYETLCHQPRPAALTDSFPPTP